MPSAVCTSFHAFHTNCLRSTPRGLVYAWRTALLDPKLFKQRCDAWRWLSNPCAVGEPCASVDFECQNLQHWPELQPSGASRTSENLLLMTLSTLQQRHCCWRMVGLVRSKLSTTALRQRCSCRKCISRGNTAGYQDKESCKAISDLDAAHPSIWDWGCLGEHDWVHICTAKQSGLDLAWPRDMLLLEAGQPLPEGLHHAASVARQLAPWICGQ